MAFCSNCGSEIKDEEKFCTNCGKAVSTEPRMHNTGNNAEDIVDKKPKKKIKIWKVILGICNMKVY